MQLSEAQCGVQSENTRPPCSLSVLSSVWVSVLVQADGREMSGAAEEEEEEEEEEEGVVFVLVVSGALEPIVTGHCQVGSAARPARGLGRNAAVLSVVEELETLGKKSKRLCSNAHSGPEADSSSCPRLALVGRFKAAVQIPGDSDCHGGCDGRHVPPSPSPLLPFYWDFDRFIENTDNDCSSAETVATGAQSLVPHLIKRWIHICNLILFVALWS